MQNRFLFLFLSSILALGIFLIYKDRLFPQQEVHYHAGFQVYIDGKLQDFTAFKYMSEKPCGGASSFDPREEQEEKAHLHDGVGDVVHIHRKNVVWGDVIKNLAIAVPKSKRIEAYIQGKVLSNLYKETIKPYQSIIIFVGDHEPIKNYVSKAVTKAHMQQVEKKSESCGKK